jgi:hypothetical protein
MFVFAALEHALTSYAVSGGLCGINADKKGAYVATNKGPA